MWRRMVNKLVTAVESDNEYYVHEISGSNIQKPRVFNAREPSLYAAPLRQWGVNLRSDS